MAQTTTANCSSSSSSIIYSKNEDFLHNFDFNSIVDLEQLSLLTSELIIDILSRTSLQTFATVRCTNTYYGNLTYNNYVLHNYNCRNNVVCGIIVKKKPWRNIERQFLPSFGSNKHDINWLPHTCTILASSLCGLLLFEYYDPDEYVSKILFVIKPTTSNAKWIPFLTSEYTATKFALVVISSNPLHFKVIRLSYTKSSDMPTEKMDYDYYNIKLFSSTTWQWREFQNIRLPSSVYPISDEAGTGGGAVHFLLSNDTILRFDIYSEEHILIFAPSTINELKLYASRLIKFHEKLGYLSISGDSSWAIRIFIRNRWVKVDDSTYNESAHEW
ncbi:unnamed protein product [Lactuca saligna]|uniref:F-box domain-containing protein n=1 Tax=Lactuca saligna TaxID=75948 RepID=A0AA36E749_LACSI|nr:unnamed protein product [Lactuca saligna]